MSINKLAAGTQARGDLGSMFGLSPEHWAMLGQLLGGYTGAAGWPMFSNAAGQQATPNASNPWAGGWGAGLSGMSGHQGTVGGNVTGLPFFPTRGGGANGFGSATGASRYTGPYNAMGNTRPYVSSSNTTEGFGGPMGQLYKQNPFLAYPGYTMQGRISGSGGGIKGSR